MDPLFCADKVLKTMLKGKTRLPIDFPGGGGYNETYKTQQNRLQRNRTTRGNDNGHDETC